MRRPGRPQMTILRMRIACWIPKATYSQSEYVILIAYPLQQRSQERASMLRYTYIVPALFSVRTDTRQNYFPYVVHPVLIQMY